MEVILDPHYYVDGPKVEDFRRTRNAYRATPVIYCLDKLSEEEVALNTWELAILKSIESEGGSANTKHIYNSFESGEFIELSEEHLRATRWEGRLAYQHQVRSHLSNLVQAGDLRRIGRGVYQLTEQGRHRID